MRLDYICVRWTPGIQRNGSLYSLSAEAPFKMLKDTFVALVLFVGSSNPEVV